MEVGPIGPMMLPGQGAQEERWEAPTSKKARGKECTPCRASPPPEIDEAMAHGTSSGRRRRRSRHGGGRIRPPWRW